LTQREGEPQAPNWRATRRDFIAAMRRLHRTAEYGKMKAE
jgi:hypothetical protein